MAAQIGDFDDDNDVDFADFSVIASYWMNPNCAGLNDCDGADFAPTDGIVDWNDLGEFCNYWLEGTGSFVELEQIFYSIAGDDGRVYDNDGGVGIGRDNDDDDVWALRLGDYNDSSYDSRYRNILSFDTSSLPADAEVTLAKVKLSCDSSTSQIGNDNPFSWGTGKAYLDVNSVCLGSDDVLRPEDWEAPADAVKAASFSDPCDSNTVITYLDSNGMDSININGKTQIKLYLETSTNNDLDEDYFGFYSGEQQIIDINKAPKLTVKYLTTSTPTAEFTSIAGDDGRVYAEFNDITQTWEDSGHDDSSNDDWALMLGDYYDHGTSTNYSERSVLSFDTSALPDDCTVLMAKLVLTRGNSCGEQPFTWDPNTCYIDVNSPCMGSSTTLQDSDWSAVSSATAVAQFKDGDPGDEQPMESDSFNPAGMNAINKTGKTQIKVYFSKESDGDTTSDLLGFYSGDWPGDVSKKPRLIIQYLITQ